MGLGNYAVGGCQHSQDKTNGICYLKLETARALNTDCTDIYPIGSAQEPEVVIYFTSIPAIDQTLEVLNEIRAKMVSETSAAAILAQED
jgi:hypothetical protein